MAVEIYLVPTLDGFKTMTDEDKEKKKKFKLGEPIKATISKPRNVKFHRKFFGLLHIVLDNLPHDAQWKVGDKIVEIKTVDNLLWHLKMQMGHFEEKVTIGGTVSYEAKSISFGAMDETQFNEFYNLALDKIIQFFLPCEKQDLINAVIDEFGS